MQLTRLRVERLACMWPWDGHVWLIQPVVHITAHDFLAVSMEVLLNYLWRIRNACLKNLEFDAVASLMSTTAPLSSQNLAGVQYELLLYFEEIKNNFNFITTFTYNSISVCCCKAYQHLYNHYLQSCIYKKLFLNSIIAETVLTLSLFRFNPVFDIRSCNNLSRIACNKFNIQQISYVNKFVNTITCNEPDNSC